MNFVLNRLKYRVASSWMHILAAFVVLLVFYPQLKSWGANAGFLYTGDVLGYYMPAIIKTHALIHSGNWAGAIDYSLFNGGSEFYLSPNFFSYHPLLWLICSLIPNGVMSQQLASFILLILVVFHSYLSLLFSFKLLTQYFGFNKSMAAFAALTYTFSHYYASALGQPPFIFSTIILPWIIYSALQFHENPTAKNMVVATLPVIFVTLGGYLPLGLATLGLALLVAVFKVNHLNEESITVLAYCKSALRCAMPFTLALVILSPFLLAIFQYHQSTSSSKVPWLFYSAHQLADTPQGWLKAVSFYLGVQSRVHEFTLTIGLIPLSIGMIFIFSKGAYVHIKPIEWRLLKFCLIIYALVVLASYGDYSALSDMVFYYVPQIGKMHIYQRFYIFTNLFFMMAVALMLKAIAIEKPFFSTRIVLGLAIFLMCYVSIELLFGESKFKGITLNNHFLFEIFLLIVFLGLLTFPGKSLVILVAAVLATLPSLNQHYDLSAGGNTFENQYNRQQLSFDGPARRSLLDFLSKFDKDVVKYIDLTPMWGSGGFEPFAKSYPYFLQNKKRVSSYGGFTFYLSAKADYLDRMPVMGESISVKPDWEYLRNTGADFAIATEQNIAEYPYLRRRVESAEPGDILSLPGGVMAIPLHFNEKSSQVLFDNGFFRVRDSLSKEHFVNLALNKPARQSSTIGNAEARLAVDGENNGDFARGSVTHTAQDPHAWLEVDLGTSQKIDAIRIWNRTDCCSYRLDNFFVFISELPFSPADTAAAVMRRAETWSQQASKGNPKITLQTGGRQGRYVRVQFNTRSSQVDSFLSIAELEVLQSSSEQLSVPSISNATFKSDFGSVTSFTYEATQPTALQYLFWPNSRLSFTVDGIAAPLLDRDGLHVLEVPAGKHTIKVEYRHWGLRLFLGFISLFMFVYVMMCAPQLLREGISRVLPISIAMISNRCYAFGKLLYKSLVK